MVKKRLTRGRAQHEAAHLPSSHDAIFLSVQTVLTPGDQAHAVAVALQREAVTVILDLVEPVSAGRDGGGFGGEAKLKGT
jgi:hypothetical protein